jgi:hypothetical protein
MIIDAEGGCRRRPSDGNGEGWRCERPKQFLVGAIVANGNDDRVGATLGEHATGHDAFVYSCSRTSTTFLPSRTSNG